MDAARGRMVWLLGALALCASLAGCASHAFPKIDSTGEKLFSSSTPPKYVDFLPDPGPAKQSSRSGININPGTIVAPVGAEVVVAAGVVNQTGFLATNEEVQWTLAPGGVGQFVAVGERQTFDSLLGGTKPEKITANYAVGNTSSRYLRLTRGTPTTEDDTYVLKGQAWVTVTSPIEGTSQLTAFAPKVWAWDQRLATSTIYWLDATWTFPPPAVNQTGTRHVLTTTVVRRTNKTPVAGYHVRYEITGGPPAGFAPDGAQILEVATDALGQANVEIMQTMATPGTNTIDVEIVRPGEMSNDGQRLAVAKGTTTKTWSSPGISIVKTGPTQAAVGCTVTYRLDVQNSGTETAREVVVSEPLVESLTFVSSNPAVTPNGQQVEWRLGDLAAGERRTIDVTYRAERPGTINQCVTAQTGNGLTAQHCLATTITMPTLEVTLAGPDQVLVGDQVTFVATITNRSGAPASGLVAVDTFDAGLQHDAARSPIERDLDALPAGQSTRFEITFRAVSAGQQCNLVRVQGAGGIQSEARACVMVHDRAAPPPTDKPELTVRKVGPARMNVGDKADFTIDVSNTGKVAATRLKIADNYDLSLDPVEATDGHARAGNDLIWIVDTLPPGRTIRLQVNCRCLNAAEKACNRATVTCDEGSRADSEACLRIDAVATPLAVEVIDLGDPVRVGNELTYEIRVRNPGSEVDRRVALVVTMPPEMTLNSINTQGPSSFTQVGQTVRFDPVAQIAGGETLTYLVRARGSRAGNAVLRAEVSSAAATRPVLGEATTTVFSE